MMGLLDYKLALVTGASSGVGAACVRALRKEKIDVIAVARRSDRLADLANETGCETISLDLTNTDEIYRQLSKFDFDILINNAGLGRGHEGFNVSSRSDIDDLIDLNMRAAIHVTRAIAPGMLDRAYGHIVHMSSITALYPLGLPVYSGTKGGIHSFAQDLRMSFAGTRVRQTEICPGRIATEFFETAFKNEEEKKRFMAGFTPLKPEDIAESVMFALRAPWSVNISLIELTPTEQIPGGVIIERSRETET